MTREDPLEAVAAILDRATDRALSRVIWFPVKHYSPACAWHIRRLIRQQRPAAVLVEGPDDGTPWLQHIVDAETRPPLTLMSVYVDRRNHFGLNGIVTPSEDLPARFRAWWPVVEYAPEYQALKTGAEVGAELVLIDAPLRATIPYDHVRRRSRQQMVNDRHLVENEYFNRLARRQRRRCFEEFWQANFEIQGFHSDTRKFMSALLLFAYCARHVVAEPERAAASLAADGTLLREAHMKWHVRQALRRHREVEKPIVVVTGAFHSVALPFKSTPAKRAKVRADKHATTLLTPHSFRALANLYAMNRQPQYGQTLWETIEQGIEKPFNAAAQTLAIQVMRQARELGAVIGTSDAISCYQAARHLADLRGNPQVTRYDLRDAAMLTFVKGDKKRLGPPVELALDDVLVGGRLGTITEAAGKAPLFRDFYDQCRGHRLDVSGAEKVVRCDLHKLRKHRLKSAFLHRCDFLGIPMFGQLDSASNWRRPLISQRNHFKGPDRVRGENLHLITETWAVRWSEAVDDRLVELSDRGPSIAAATANVLDERVMQARGRASSTTKLLVLSAQMMMTENFERILNATEQAVASDAKFESLVDALTDFGALLDSADDVVAQTEERLKKTVATLFNKACLTLPHVTQSDNTSDLVTHLQTLSRVSLTFDAASLDRVLLVEKLREMVATVDTDARVRGAGFGVLFAMGSTREKVVASELRAYTLGTPENMQRAAMFLDGLLSTSKHIVMGSPRMLRVLNEVLTQLDWPTFKRLLPSFRRAFTQFIPSELDRISARVSEEIGLAQPRELEGPFPESTRRTCAAMDRRVGKHLRGLFEGPIEHLD